MGIVDRSGGVGVSATGALVGRLGTGTVPVDGALRDVVVGIVLRSGGVRIPAGAGVRVHASGTIAVIAVGNGIGVGMGIGDLSGSPASRTFGGARYLTGTSAARTYAEIIVVTNSCSIASRTVGRCGYVTASAASRTRLRLRILGS